MSRTSMTAVVIHTGTERSNVLLTTELGTEELHEALLDVFGAPVDLVGIDDDLQLRELGTIGRVGDVRMSDVESLAVGQELLDLAGEDEVGEEQRCAGMGREAHDGRGRKD